MTWAIYPALFFTVAMLVTNAYFLMGGLPLLVLQHDTPLDARFVRGFFRIYTLASAITALGAAASYALWAHWVFAAGAALVLAATGLLRRHLIPALQRLGERIQDSDAAAISGFRRAHITALAVNLVQLLLVVWGITRLSF